MALKATDWILYIFMSYAVLTVLNLIVHQIFPSVAIISTGYFLILLFVSVFLVLLFSVLYDKRIDKIELWTVIIVAASLAGSFYLIREYIPELFSILNNTSGGVFSIFK